MFLKANLSPWAGFSLPVLLLLILILGGACSALSGCEDAKQYAINTATVTTGVIDLDKSFAQAEAAVTSNLSLFTSAEQTQLLTAKNDLEALRMDLRAMVSRSGGLPQVLVNADVVRQQLDRARSSYRTARDVIALHVNELPADAQNTVRRFDLAAQRVDTALVALTTAPDGADISKTVSDVISLAASSVKLLAAAGLL